MCARKVNPIEIKVEKGFCYLWCSCGNSTTQPLCDGRAHIGSEYRPIRYRAENYSTLLFCVCKKTKTPPICDGSHNE